MGTTTEEAAEPVDASNLSGLTWATSALDVSPPISLDALLQGLQLLATDAARKTGASFRGGTPASLQVIKSGALSITKWASGLVATVGGLTAATGAVAGAIGAFGDAAGAPETAALIAGSAVLLGLVAIALAVFVAADVLARGIATAARHEGRAEVASAFLSATGGMPRSNGAKPITDQALMLALAAFPGKVLVTTDASSDESVKGVAMDPGSHELTFVLGTDRIKLGEIKSFKIAP